VGVYGACELQVSGLGFIARFVCSASLCEQYECSKSTTPKAMFFYGELTRALSEGTEATRGSCVCFCLCSIEATQAVESDFWYDVVGWAMLAGLMTAWVFMARVSSK